MEETLRDVINDAICARLMETHHSDYDVANEEARNLCDAIFYSIGIEPEFQDVSWTITAENIVGSEKSVRFDYKVRTEVCTRFGERGFIIVLGYTGDNRKIYLVETIARTTWMRADDFTVLFCPAQK